MAEEEVNILQDWYCGEDKILDITVFQSLNHIITATPQNISGWQLRWDLRLTPASKGDPLITKASGSGITITDAVNGRLQVSVASADTDNLDAQVYSHALKRTESGSETVLLTGEILLQRATTR